MSATTHMPLLFSLHGVGQIYGAHRALGPLDLEIRAGEQLALIGPSGCGKSTLIRLLAGLVTPSEGTIRFHGKALSDLDMGPYRQNLGYVIQNGGLFPHLTAARNVTLMARQLGWSKARIQDRLVELARLVHLGEDRLAQYPADLSGGQRQRVSLMRALMLEPEVLLLDEPLGALDPMIRYQLQTDLRDIFQTLGLTVILVTHDLAEAAFLSKRIVLLREGQLVQDGGFKDLVDHPADPFVSAFVKAQRGVLAGGAL
ncbi:ABC transporter ATP-binding protein [Iodidimonas muriae]|uniref:ABC transporter ATP-binding protein n=1 Tax=Iodidimonas muriae TaxID=261467 RepID=A0ABQ2L9N8_9PROT|nr:ATP-binding cassette domain-containing protein [Iodidimonas muriae]GER06015.1 ABC transporter ATP-binding protein [Kordiimonadales bacterium JCM 17843]GGO07842.1 ABC transporter ATP-binding protein [Iodidimonas muriae]